MARLLFQLIYPPFSGVVCVAMVNMACCQLCPHVIGISPVSGELLSPNGWPSQNRQRGSKIGESNSGVGTDGHEEVEMLDLCPSVYLL